jgi:hypothetical protein
MLRLDRRSGASRVTRAGQVEARAWPGERLGKHGSIPPSANDTRVTQGGFMSNTLHRLRAIGRSCLWLSLVAGALAAHAEPMLKLTWTVDGKTTTQTIPLPQPGKVAELGKMVQRPHEATSGDCSGFDTSALVRSYPEGDVLLVRSSPVIDEGAIVQVQFDSVRYAGVTSTVSVRAGCTVKNGGTHRITADSSAFMRFGQSMMLDSSSDARRSTRLDAELLR